MAEQLLDQISIRLSGRNGDGVFSQGEALAKICSRSGLQVHGSRNYQSIIRGGHVSYSIRAAEHDVRAPSDYIDVLIAIREDSFTVDAMTMMREGGYVLYDSVGSRIKDPQVPAGVNLIDIPAWEIAQRYSNRRILMNTVFIGAAIALYGLDTEVHKSLIREFFSKKPEVIDMNIGAATDGYNFIKEQNLRINHQITFSPTNGAVFIGGNEAIAFGMLNGGLQSYAWYPMTPASSLGIFLAKYGPQTGCMVKQMEDEINVANFAVGAGYAGARSACATSGGGFALMTEAVGLAAMIEAPVVFIEVSRGGPSTGLPTKQEQGDLNQLLGASQGDFPRAIIAQLSVEDGFYLGQEALNIADKYQIPVLVASDLYLGEHFETLPSLDYNRIPIDQGELITDELSEDMLPYKRYKITETGVSPRTIPGVKNGMHDAGSDEHDEFGALVSDRRAGYPEMNEVRIQQMQKRMRKMDALLKDLPTPQVDGHEAGDTDVLIVGWGSSFDTIKEARSLLERQGVRTAQLQIKYIMPFHSYEVGQILNNYQNSGGKILLIEGNYTGQMGRHIRAETGFEIKEKYLRYDGDYILPREVVGVVQQLLNKGGL
ncbi:MAG: 2-oxoacid:acceptor oxidoreductase subunit alpha [Candidatus Kariarchaeaceae archaeon]